MRRYLRPIAFVLAILAGLYGGDASAQMRVSDRPSGPVGTLKFPDGTAAAPSIAFASVPGSGWYKDSTTSVIFVSSASERDVRFSNTSVLLHAGIPLAWADGDVLGTADLFIRRDAANTLAQRNETNAQTFNLYHTYTDASNYERAGFQALSGGAFRVNYGQAAGTGTSRYFGIANNGTEIWRFSTSGHFLAGTDNTYDIGASGATRPRSIYAGTGLYAPAIGITKAGSNEIGFFAGTGASYTTFGEATNDGVYIGWNASSNIGEIGTHDTGGVVLVAASDVLGLDTGASVRVASKAIINTAPTTPVACTSPTVTNSNGTLAFQVDVGTSCTGVSTLVVTMPAASNAWAGCTATHVNSPTTRLPRMTASTTTSITFTNFDATTGLAADWSDGNDVRVGGCVGG